MFRILTFLFILISINFAHGQNNERFYNISRRDGLSSGSVTSIVQDLKGLIWIGTKQGITRYDGHDFLQYHMGNSQISSNDISSLLVDFSGQLWIGTNGGGLYHLELTTQEITRVFYEGLGERIKSIYQGEDSSLWVLSEKGIVQLNQTEKWKIENLPSEISINVSAMGFWDNSLWIATVGGILYHLEKDGSYLSYTLSNTWPGITIQNIHRADGENIFVGTRQYGLIIFNKENESSSKYAIEALDIRDIVADGKGAIWVGTDGNGIYKIDKGITSNYLHRSANENSLVSNAIHKCFEDRDGNLWFGSAWDGISIIDRRLDNLQFLYSDFKGLKEAGILNIYIESDKLWFGTDGLGLSIQSQHGLKKDITQVIPTGSYIQFIDKLDEKYWIGTFQSGLYVVENKENGNVWHFTTNSGLSHDDVRDVEQLDQESFLIGTWGGGLNLYDQQTGRFRKLEIGNGLPLDVVVLKRIGDDEILVGTFGQGLFVFRPSDLSLKSILPHINNIVSISKNDKGIWVGTWGEGLHFSEYPFSKSELITSDELPKNSNIFSIISSSDSDDTWLTTNEKILKISSDKKIERLPLATQQFHINAANTNSKGRMYFGTTEGVISFMPEIMKVSIDKEIEILDIKILNKSLNEFEGFALGVDLLELNYDHNLITLRFATPVYPSSREETYEVRLEPINSDWINVGGERSMTYADLKPGNYAFSVRNSTSQAEEKFQFRILNPWWKTWWAYTIFMTIFSALLYAFGKYSINLERVKNQLEIEKMGREKESEISNIKQRFFVNVSHEIRTPLTLIIGEIEQLSIKAGASKSLVNSINNLRNNGNHLIQLVNELLDFRKLDQGGMKLKVAQGNFVVFCNEIYLAFLNKADANSIDYKFQSDGDEIVAWYDRDQLEKVFFNLLTNAFKNTPSGGKIEFSIKKNENFIEAAVKDTGYGISAREIENVFKRFYQKENDHENNTQGFGIGLSIVQDIINLHHGTVSVESESGQGSCFKVKLRFGRDHFKEEDFIFNFENSDSQVGYKILDANEQGETHDNRREDEILVVEDNPDIREFIVKILSSRFHVMEAANGLEAYEMALERLPDLIISDVMMPEMDGITLTKKLKQNTSTSHIPIILLTARTGTIFKKEGFEMGADEYITKPFNSAVLISRIENIIKSREILTNQIRNELATRPSDLNLSTPDESFLKELVHVIQFNLDNSELNAKLIASEMGMSHSVIYKKIKALTGYPLVEFIRDYRLQQAAEILGKYKFTVAEACYKVGFSDKKYFTQIFKKKYGITPSEHAKGQQ
ncbi:MAG: signal transduction histidine kinase/DNA-binding response OmpR family regulator [Cyclobacteriaceae bacterium]|jgi:signal transduction histidine kinase/DNA-binding response OmpR family regulator/ligand-binding sensor domain-containing protein